MKISAKQYARSLYELMLGKKHQEAEKIIADFVALLAKNRDLNKEEEIIAELSKIFTEDGGEREVELTSARLLPASAKTSLKAYLAKKSGSEKIVISEKIEPTIIGGFIVRYDDKVIDGSLKQHLSNFQKQLSN